MVGGTKRSLPDSPFCRKHYPRFLLIADHCAAGNDGRYEGAERRQRFG